MFEVRHTAPLEHLQYPGGSTCPACDVPTWAFVFPALYTADPTPSAGEQLLVDDEASCFYHEGKKAIIACERCGRFLCTLCDVKLGEEHVCPRCIEAGVEKNKMRHLTRRHIQYDNVALALALMSLVCGFWFMSWLTAPIAIFVAIRYWKKPLSVLRRSRWRFVLAIVLALGQLAAWGVFAVHMIRGLSNA